jgi:anti-sigma B factor antagonist
VKTLSCRPLEEPRAFALEGELDMASAGDVLAALQDAPADGDLVLDLSGLSFMDSSGLRMVLQLANGRADGVVVLRNPTPAVNRILEIALAGETPGVRVEPAGAGE